MVLTRINKRGQNMTLGTIILIVLGIAVLVFLIFGFSTGWGNLWSRITAYGGGDANIDTIKQACALACASNAENDYCMRERTLVREKGKKEVGSCGTFGLDSCSNIKCASEEFEKKKDEWAKEKAKTPPAATPPVPTP